MKLTLGQIKMLLQTLEKSGTIKWKGQHLSTKLWDSLGDWDCKDLVIGGVGCLSQKRQLSYHLTANLANPPVASKAFYLCIWTLSLSMIPAKTVFLSFSLSHHSGLCHFLQYQHGGPQEPVVCLSLGLKGGIVTLDDTGASTFSKASLRSFQLPLLSIWQALHPQAISKASSVCIKPEGTFLCNPMNDFF